jgi:putative addiction module component (TIGR02574 family)
MSSLLNTLGIDRLTPAERLQLLQEIWDSLAHDVEVLPLTEPQRQELDRRLAALDADPNRVVSWEEVEAQALARLRK